MCIVGKLKKKTARKSYAVRYGGAYEWELTTQVCSTIFAEIPALNIDHQFL